MSTSIAYIYKPDSTPVEVELIDPLPLGTLSQIEAHWHEARADVRRALREAGSCSPAQG